MVIRGKKELLINNVRTATVLDCEGWITIQKTNSRGVGLVLCLGVGNTNPKLTDWLQATFGGSVYKTRRASPQHKDYYTWRINGNKAVEILKNCIEYMLLKQAQARIAIQFQETMHGRNSLNQPCTPEYIEQMWAFKKELSKLNRKGKILSPAETERKDTKPAPSLQVVKRQSELPRKPEESDRNARAQALAA